MPRGYLTDERIKSLAFAAEGTRYDVPDRAVPGLFVRVGTKTKKFVLMARFGESKNSTRRTIGGFPKVSLEEARGIAKRWHDLVERGLDPKIEEKLGDRQSATGGRGNVGSAAMFLEESLGDLLRVAEFQAIVLMKNNRPSTVVVSAEEFVRLKEAAGEPVQWSVKGCDKNGDLPTSGR